MLRPPVLSRMLATLIGSAAANPALLGRTVALPKASAPEAVRKNWRRLNFMTTFPIYHSRADHSARFLLVPSVRQSATSTSICTDRGSKPAADRHVSDATIASKIAPF